MADIMLLRLVVAVILVMHGLGHVMGFSAAWTPAKMGLSDRPWIFSPGITIDTPVGRTFGLLWLVAMIGFVASGLGLLFFQGWWPQLAVASAFISLVAILPWWGTVPAGARYGAVLVDLLVLVLLLGPWAGQVWQA